MPQLPPIDPKPQCKLESLFGPDPLNPCADLAGMGSDILKRIHFLQTEINSLKITYNNISLGIDRLLGLTRPCGEYVPTAEVMTNELGTFVEGSRFYEVKGC